LNHADLDDHLYFQGEISWNYQVKLLSGHRWPTPISEGELRSTGDLFAISWFKSKYKHSAMTEAQGNDEDIFRGSESIYLFYMQILLKKDCCYHKIEFLSLM